MTNTSTRHLSSTTISLHWVVGLTMIALLASGIIMEEFELYSMYDIHKSIGVVIMLPVIARIVWRIKEGWPESAGDYTSFEKVSAKAVHYILIIATVLMPISGAMMSAAGGHGLGLFGLELVAANPDPANPNEVIPLNAMIAGIGHQAHSVLPNLMIAALILHIVGAYKHHIVDKDLTLKRMLGKT